jgi:hypothetical protein
MLGDGRAVKLAAGHLEVGRADLGRWGELIASGETRARIETASGGTIDLDEDMAAQLRVSLLWLDEASGLFLVIQVQGASIVAFDLAAEETWEVDRLERFEERGFRRLGVRPTPSGGLLVLYEYGLLCIGADGHLLWHAAHDDLTTGFESVNSDSVTIGSQYPGGDRVSRYSLADGKLVFS